MWRNSVDPGGGSSGISSLPQEEEEDILFLLLRVIKHMPANTATPVSSKSPGQKVAWKAIVQDTLLWNMAPFPRRSSGSNQQERDEWMRDSLTLKISTWSRLTSLSRLHLYIVHWKEERYHINIDRYIIWSHSAMTGAWRQGHVMDSWSYYEER